MRTDPRHPLVDEYLTQLRQAAAGLPRSQRDELLAEITTHVDTGVSHARSDAEVRNLLDDLGRPDDIINAADPGSAPPGPPTWLALSLGLAAWVVLSAAGLVLGLPMGVAALVVGLKARRGASAAGRPCGMATAGIILGGGAIAFLLALYALMFTGVVDTYPG